MRNPDIRGIEKTREAEERLAAILNYGSHKESGTWIELTYSTKEKTKEK